MPKFLIEVLQEADGLANIRVTNSIRGMGSHFATHADWRRRKGVYSGSMIVETADERSALSIVPPGMRRYAHISQLAQVETT
jgi:hypothetical protein